MQPAEPAAPAGTEFFPGSYEDPSGAHAPTDDENQDGTSTPTPVSPTDGSVSSVTSDQSTMRELDLDYSGFLSPKPENERIAAARDERRYRLVLQHDFHPSRASLPSPPPPHFHAHVQAVTLPLWTPGPVRVGAVGFLEKPAGRFVTLFNALDPVRTSAGAMEGTPSVHGYGAVASGQQRADRRNPAQRGMDTIQSWLRKNAGGPPSCVFLLSC